MIRHPNPLATILDSRAEAVVAYCLQSTAGDGVDCSRLDIQARALRDRELHVVLTTCPDCGGRAYQEPECTRILPDGTRETYTPVRCAKRCQGVRRKCYGCNEPFVPTGVQRYCSDACRFAGNIRKRKEAPMSIPENPILTEAQASAEVDQVGPHTVLVCPCGCGRPLKPGNRYGSSGCWRRHRIAGSPEPAPVLARLCECGCGRPIGPRGTRYASIGCASRRPKGKMSDEARANMSAAAKARVARDGYVRPGQPVAYKARQDAQAEVAKLRTELLEATPPEPAAPIRLDPPRGSLSPPPEPVEPDEWGRTHLHEQIARVRRNLAGWRPQTSDDLQRREDLAHTLAALERADSVIRAAQGDLAAAQDRATRQAGEITRLLARQNSRQNSKPMAAMDAILAETDLAAAWAVHWLRRLPNDAARKRAYQLACQMPEVAS